MNRRSRRALESYIYQAWLTRIGRSPCVRFLAAVTLILPSVGMANQPPSAPAPITTNVVQVEDARSPDLFHSLESQTSTKLSDIRWFCILCGCAVGVLLWQLYISRLDRKTLQSQSRVAGMLEERERIARELHDTLIQSIHALILTLQKSTAHLPTTNTLRREIDSALDTAEDLLDEARDRVSGLRVSPVALDVARAIANSVNSAMGGAQCASFKLAVSGNPQPLRQNAAEQIYSITCEAVANAIAHAEAKTIEVQIGYQKRQVRVNVRDDGRGMSPIAQSKTNATRHFGLLGMRERADLLGAQLTIRSREGAGTEIALHVPDTSAYLSASPSVRWSQRLRDAVGTAPHTAKRLMFFGKNIAGAANRYIEDGDCGPNRRWYLWDP